MPIPCRNMSVFKFSICLPTLSWDKALPQAESTLNRTKLPALAWHYPTAAKKLQATTEARVNIARERQGSGRVASNLLGSCVAEKTAARQIWWNLKANPAACNLISWHAAATLHAAASFGQFAMGRLQHSHVQERASWRQRERERQWQKIEGKLHSCCSGRRTLRAAAATERKWITFNLLTFLVKMTLFLAGGVGVWPGPKHTSPVMTKTFAARPHANAQRQRQRQRKSLPYLRRIESWRRGEISAFYRRFLHQIRELHAEAWQPPCSLRTQGKTKKKKEFALLKSSQHTCRSERQKLRIRHVRRDKSASDIWIFLFKFSALAPFLGCVSLFCVCFSFDILSHMSEATCKIFTKK